MRTLMLTVTSLVLGVACSGSTTSVTPGETPVASVSVALPLTALVVGQTTLAAATPKDASGAPLSNRSIAWQTSNAAIATVSDVGLVAALTPGSATITATSGSVKGNASVTVTAVVTPPPPPPPPPTPGTTVFSDDFESGSLSKWNESNSTTQKLINDPASTHGGSSFLRMTYGINGADGGWLNKYFTSGFRQLYVRYYIRFSTNFVGGTKLISLRGAPIGNPTAGVGRAGICPNGQDTFSSSLVNDFGDTYATKMYTYWQDMWADGNGQCWGRYGPTPATMPYISPMPALTKGVWHKIEFTLKMNSAAGTADGAQRFWVDGVKYGEWTGIRFGDPSILNLGVLTISGAGDTSQIQWLDIDDLVLTTDFPTQSQP